MKSHIYIPIFRVWGNESRSFRGQHFARRHLLQGGAGEMRSGLLGILLVLDNRTTSVPRESGGQGGHKGCGGFAIEQDVIGAAAVDGRTDGAGDIGGGCQRGSGEQGEQDEQRFPVCGEVGYGAGQPGRLLSGGWVVRLPLSEGGSALIRRAVWAAVVLIMHHPVVAVVIITVEVVSR